ncbi:MAG: strawberry notch family protein [Planctomycetota bacterium]
MSNWWEQFPAVKLGENERLLLDDEGKSELVDRDEAFKRNLEEDRKRQKLEADQKAAKEYVAGSLPGQPLAEMIAADTLSPIYRGVGTAIGSDSMVERADELSRSSGLVEQALRESEEGGIVPDWMQSGARGAARSLGTMAIASRAGGKLLGPKAGVPAAIGAASIQEGNRAIVDGKDLGLEGGELALYAGSQAFIEALPATIFQRAGLGGIESLVARRSLGQSVRGGVADAVKRLGAEIPEEIVTEVGHSVASEFAGTDPTALDPERIQQTVTETIVQTMFMSGFTETANAVPAIAEGRQRKARLEELQELRRQDQATQEANRRKAEEQLGEGDIASPEGGNVSTEPAVEPAAETETQSDEPTFERFAENSGTLGIPRAEMPQIRSEQRGALSNYVRSRGVDFERESVRAGDLKPSQAEYSPDKVEEARNYEGPERAILVSEDGFVIDGHHQWLKNLTEDPEGEIEVVRLGGRAIDLIPMIRDFPSSEVDSATEPTGGVPAVENEPRVPERLETPEPPIAGATPAVEPQVDVPGAQTDLSENNPVSGPAEGNTASPEVETFPQEPVSEETGFQGNQETEPETPIPVAEPQKGTRPRPQASDTSAEIPEGAIGLNSDGEPVYEDENGVRSVGGANEKVEMRPVRTPNGGVTYQGFIDPNAREDRFKTKDELDEPASDIASPVSETSTPAPEPRQGGDPDNQASGPVVGSNTEYDTESRVSWRQREGESRADYKRRLKKEGWSQAESSGIEVLDSPGVVLRQSQEQLREKPYKRGDRVVMSTGFTKDDLQIQATVESDTVRGDSTVDLLLDNGQRTIASAYYTTPAPKSDETASSEAEPQKGTRPRPQAETQSPAAEEAPSDTVSPDRPIRIGDTVEFEKVRNGASGRGVVTKIRPDGKYTVSGSKGGFLGIVAPDEVKSVEGNVGYAATLQQLMETYQGMERETIEQDVANTLAVLEGDDRKQFTAFLRKFGISAQSNFKPETIARAVAERVIQLESIPKQAADVVRLIEDNAFQLSQDVNIFDGSAAGQKKMKLVQSVTSRVQQVMPGLNAARVAGIVRYPETARQELRDVLMEQFPPEIVDRAIPEASPVETEPEGDTASPEAESAEPEMSDIDRLVDEEMDRQLEEENPETSEETPTRSGSSSESTDRPESSPSGATPPRKGTGPVAPETRGAAQPVPDGWTQDDIRFLRDRVAKGDKVFVYGGDAIGLPVPQDVLKPADHVGMGYFKTETPDYEVDWEGGGSALRTPEGNGYTVLQERRGEFPYDKESTLRELDKYLSKPEPKKPTKIQQAADTARQEADDLFNQFIDKAKGKLSSNLDPELATIAVRYAIAEIKAGTLQFAAFAEKVATNLPAEMRDRAIPYFESAWRRAHARGMVDDPAGTFSEVLGEESPETEVEPEPISPQEQDIALAERIAPLLGSSDFTRDDFFRAADEVYGGTRAEGAYGDSRAYNALELAVNKRMGDIVSQDDIMSSDASGVASAITAITDFMETVPQHKARTGEKDTLQQFSTPPAYSYVVNWIANVNDSDTVLEPSAGVGGLAIHAKNAGAKVAVNELDEDRLVLMRGLEFDSYFNEDAEQIDSILAGKVNPTVVVMNPPFSRSGRRTGNKKQIGMDRKHMDRAMELLPDGGRMVAIVGAGMRGQSQGMTRWLENHPYQVRANVEVAREVYKGYGTQFPTRVLVIDKLPANDAVSVVEAKVENLSQLASTLEGVRNDRPEIGSGLEQASAEPNVSESAGDSEAATGPNSGSQSATGSVGSRPESGGGRGGSTSGSGGRGSNRPAGSTTGAGGGRSGRGSGSAGGSGNRGGSANAGTRSGAASDTTSRQPGDGAGRGLTLRPVPPEARRVEKITDVTYEPYVPSIEVEGSTPHPASIVESAAMSAINAPPITYTPNIDQSVVEGYTNENGEFVNLSIVQLEAVAAAGQSHQQVLPDGTRRGYMIGDGTGVGKAREAAGVMMDNWNQGRRKAVWISKNFKLLGQAKEEWERVGGDPSDVMSQGKVKAGTKIRGDQGILFTGYGTLPKSPSAKAKEEGNTLSRVDQIVDWVGEDFDGVIVFDESHKMGNAIAMKSGRGTTKPSQIALAGVELQNRLPGARVVYMSATSATEVYNLSYAPRLGLWGPGTQFADARAFISRITSGGVAAMEVVAADMKAMGLYAARNLAFDDGTTEGTVTFDRVNHELTPDQRAGYDAASEAWQVVLENINEALEMTGAEGDGRRRGAVMSQFWGSNQRFWNGVVMSMMTPTLVNNIEEDLASGKSALIQLTSTGEAATNRAIARLKEGQTLEDVDASPAYILIDMVRNAFPVQRFETFIDDNGNEQARPVRDANGNPVNDPRAVRMREQLLDRVAGMPISNKSALDEIISHFGVNQVSEITGRTRRLIEKDGEIVEERRTDAASEKDKTAFMEGRKRVLIFSEAGGTGASYHADKTRENQQQRSHYLFQPGWQANVAVQGLGRAHRSNQASAPVLHLMEPDLPGYKRFISTIARRLSQLGALTKGQRQAGDSGVFDAKDNLESTESVRAMRRLIEDAHAGEGGEVTLDLIEGRMGLEVTNDDGSLKAEMPTIGKFLNRLLNLGIEDQNNVYNEFDDRLQSIVEEAIANDTLDQGLETIKSLGTTKKSEDVANVHSTGAETKHVVLNVKEPVGRRTFKEATNNYEKDLIGFYRSRSTGKVFLMSDAKQSEQDSKGRVHKLARQVGVESSIRKVRIPNLENNEKWEKISRDDAMSSWETEYEGHSGYREKEMHLITGALLPVWNNLPDTNPKIKRALTDDGEQVLGRVIDREDLDATLRNLGVSYQAPEISSEEASEVIGAGGRAELTGGWKIRNSVIEGESNVELEGPQESDWPILEPMGIFRRRVGYRMRYFIPMNQPTEVLAQLAENGRRVVSVKRPRGSGSDAFASDIKNAKRRKLRKGVDPNPTERINRGDIIKTWEREFDVPIRTGGFRRNAAGIYKSVDAKRAPEIVRMREANATDLLIASHEIAHHIDRKMDLRKSLRDLRKSDPALYMQVRTELKDLDYDNKRKASPAGGEIKEGIAEAFRHILTGSHTEASSHAAAIDWVRDQVLSHPKFGPAMAKAIGHVVQYDTMSPLDEIMSQVGRAPKDLERFEQIKKEMEDRWFGTVENFVDRSRILADIQREGRKKGYKGIGIEDAYFAYLMSAGPHAAMSFEKGIHSIRTLEPLGRYGVYSLADLVNDEADEESAIAYAYAKHTMFMQEKKAERGEGPYNTGIDPETAQEFLDSVDPKDEVRYEQYAQRISEILDDVLEMRVDAGELALRDAQNVRDYYQDNMFSLLRVGDEGGRSGASKYVNLPKSLMARSREGSDRAILHPIESLMRKIQQGYSSAAKSRVSHVLVENLQGAEGMGVFGDKVEPGTDVFKFKIEEVLNDLVSEGVIEEEFAKDMRFASNIREGFDDTEAKHERFAKRHGLDQNSPTYWSDLEQAVADIPDIMSVVSLFRPDWTPSKQKATVVIRDKDGNPQMWELNRRLYDLTTGMDVDTASRTMRILHSATGKWFRAGAVLLNSAFGVRNLQRDFFEFQGRSRFTSGATKTLSPIHMLGAVIAHQAAKATGHRSKHSALIDALNESGGAMFSRIGFDIDSLGRARRRGMKKIKHRQTLGEKLVFGPVETFKNAVDRMQDFIAVSDLPPRLAEMKAYLASKGYTLNKNGKFEFEGREVDKFPEQIRIEAVSAAAEATTNFKRSGKISRQIDLVLPFFNATLQAQYRQAKQLKNLTTRERATEFNNTLIYYSGLAAIGVAYALYRSDDEDYKEQASYERDQHLSFGEDGTTYFQLSKPRDAGVIMNVAEAIVAKSRENDLADEGDEAAKVILNDVLNRFPTGGGLFRGGLEVFGNYDFFRRRAIEGQYLQGAPKALRTTPYTSRTTDFIGFHTGKYLGLSPVQFQHLADSYTGGAYGRWTGAIESLTGTGKRTLSANQIIPGAKALFPGRYRAGSINDFYKEYDRTNEVVGTNKAMLKAEMQRVDDEADVQEIEARYQSTIEPAAKRLSKLRDARDIMSAIRQAEPKFDSGARTFKYEPYINGIARDALGRDPIPNSPNPFRQKDIPAPLQKELKKFVMRKAMLGVALENLPSKDTKDATLIERLEEYETEVKSHRKWLEDHAASPVVQDAIKSAKEAKIFSRKISKPTWNPEKGESWAKHYGEMKRYQTYQRLKRESLSLGN